VAIGARRVSRYDHGLDDLAKLLADEPAYRARQLYTGLYESLAEPEAIHVLPAGLRSRVGAIPELAPALSVESEQRADNGQTVKWLFELRDQRYIETVLMHYSRHSTVCVSSQAGCAMACSFCATGHAGFTRQLSVGEIVEQVVLAMRAAREGGRRLDNVVFMGMGEPLANAATVLAALRVMTGELGLGARHLTVSTVGVVPGIRKLATEPLQVNLAVSLHAANDELRNRLVPLNKRYPIEVLIAACESYISVTHRRISFEWALMDGVNDRPGDAAELAGLARRLRAHVNLIPLNPTPGGRALGLNGTSPAGVRVFRDRLVSHGVNVTVRRTRGVSIDAACGQLAAAVPVALARRPPA
jgi:23S rRNA (adenine2503-C2)-methyltransferase